MVPRNININKQSWCHFRRQQREKKKNPQVKTDTRTLSIFQPFLVVFEVEPFGNAVPVWKHIIITLVVNNRIVLSQKKRPLTVLSPKNGNAARSPKRVVG